MSSNYNYLVLRNLNDNLADMLLAVQILISLSSLFKAEYLINYRLQPILSNQPVHAFESESNNLVDVIQTTSAANVLTVHANRS